QTSGIPATGRYRQQTTANQAGQSFPVRFTCTDSGNPPASTSASATIRVVEQAPPPPTSTPTPRPTPIPCRGVPTPCANNSECCTGQCGGSGITTNGTTCCV